MNQTSIMIMQQQVLRAIVAARAEVTAALALVQASIQQAAGGPVTLSAQTLQAVLVRLQAAAQALAAFRGAQMQQVRVVVGNVDVTATQNQILEAIAAAAAAIDAQIAAVQQLLTQANAMGGQVTISNAAAQALAVSLRSVAESLVMLEARQQQLVNITTSAGGGQAQPQAPVFPGNIFPGNIFPGGIFGQAGGLGGVAGQQGQGFFGNI
ncbi:MAG TPA: hypothetical protein VNT01_13165 [Symbiobacteriaceae bacterium]|nr:hypothetical protein [Symbiobacteriaceae bacterium]